MFFTFPEDAHWNAESQSVEFGVEIGEYHGVVRVPRRVFQLLLPETPTPERCVEAYYLQRTRFESVAERKLRRRQLTEDGNVEIGGRDLRDGSRRSMPMTTVARQAARVRIVNAMDLSKCAADDRGQENHHGGQEQSGDNLSSQNNATSSSGPTRLTARIRAAPAPWT
jgi:hypothetical protein